MKINDNKIINYIKLFPFYIVLLTNIIFLTYLFIDFQYQLNSTKDTLQKDLTNTYKDRIKNETKKVIDYISLKKANNEKELREALKEKNKIAYQIINNIYQKNKTKEKKVIIKKIKTALEKVTFFEDRGYYFLMDINGKNYFHPIFKEYENKSLLKIRDNNGLLIIKEMTKIAKNKNEGFIKYSWFKPNDKKNQYKEIAHIKKFEPLNCYIVSSDYTDTLNNKWKRDVIQFLSKVEFKDHSHYFILNKKTKKYVWHEKKEIEGIEISKADYTLNSKKVFNKLLNNKDGSFYTYNVYDLDRNIILKTSYTRTIEDWDWILGIGFYQKDIDKNIKIKQNELKEIITNNLLRTLYFLVLISIIVLIISRFFSKIIERRFKIYNFAINRKLVMISRQEKILAQQSKMAAMGEMIENIAHQWRQPLSVISTSATGLMLNKEYNNLSDEQFFDGLNSINKSSQYLSETIENFRNFYLNSDENTLFRVDKMIDKSILLIKSRIEDNHIKIEISTKKLEFFGIENEFIQVILNIINNAIDQFKNINNPVENIIKIDIFNINNNISIEISDNAGGIESKILDRIFEPYFTTKDKNIGTGIGLYMSKNIIEKHYNGTLKVKNNIMCINEDCYKGAKFIINLKL